MATTFLTERLMRAADALLHHGHEVIEVRYVGVGKWRNAKLLGRGATPGTVRLGVWCEGGEIREGSHPIRFCDCLLLPEAEVMLEKTARVQARASGTTDCTELARAMQFISRVQRGRDGRFADVTHRAERAGVI